MWNSALKRNLFDPAPDAEMKDFLRTAIPRFEAPRDIGAWRRRIPELRREILRNVFLRGFTAAQMESIPKVVWGEVLRPDPSYSVRKLRYEIYPGYWIPALLYDPVTRLKKVPAVMFLMGHGQSGKFWPQIHCANLARRGMLALNLEFIGMGELGGDRVHSNIAYLNLTGLSGVGLFYMAMKKGLDILLSHKRADRRRVAATGCSGGGWQSIVISALDPRVTLSVPVAGYTSCRGRVECPADVGDLEQVPPDLAKVADYPALTAMLVPRPALIIYNEMDDCCFATARARPAIYDPVRPVYRAFNAEDKFETYSNTDPGNHNYDADNRSQLYKFLNKHFGLDSPISDIHRDEEILPESSLTVGLPEEQETLLSIALKRARKLNAERKPPQSASDRQKLRRSLSELIRLPEYDAADTIICRTGNLSQRMLKIGPWSVPASFHSARNPESAEVWIADGGRSSMAGRKPDESSSVCAADIMGTGENRPGYNLLMLFESAGQRLLGIQVAQILACAKLVRRRTGIRRIDIVSDGLRTYVASLLAVAIEPSLFRRLTVSSPISSLSELIEIPCRHSDDFPLFCMGLLEVADIKEMKMLLGDVELVQPQRGVPNEFPGRAT